MRRTLLVGACTVMTVLAAVVSLSGQAAQSNTTVGTWKLNLAKSKYNPGPPPKSQTTTIEAVGNGVKNTTEGVAADGSRVAYSWTVNYDGKDNAYTGVGGVGTPVGTPNGADTIAVKRIDAYTTESTQKKAGKVVNTSRTVISKDGKTRTITSKGTNASGQPTNNVTVYDRQ